MALPDLKAVLTAKTDGFESALERAAKATEKTSAQIKAATDKIGLSFEALKGAAAGLVAGLSVGAFVGLVKGAIDAADHLNDLSKKTGIAVETLGGLGFAAEQSGSNLDSASAGFVKLEKSIAAAAAGNKEAAGAFDAIGVKLKDAAGNAKSTDKVFLELADRFASFEDGPNKAALAIAIFGKAGADLIPLLNEGGKAIAANIAYFERYSGVTTDLAKRADEFNDTTAKLGLLQGAFGKTLAAELLPTLQTLANLFVESKEKGTAFASVAEGIGVIFNKLVGFAADVVFVFRGVGTEIGGMAAQLNALVHLDLKGFSAIGDAMKADADNARKELDKFKFDLNNAASQNKATLSGGTFDQEGASKIKTGKTAAPSLPKTGGAQKEVDLAKKLLDQQLKDLDNFIAREKELLTERNTFLQLNFDRSNISSADYYAERQKFREEDLRNEGDALRKQIALAQAYVASKSASKDPRDQGKAIEGQTKVNDLVEKLRKTERSATIDRIKDIFASQDALEKFSQSISDLDAQILTLKGDTVGAFNIDFQSRNADKRKSFTTIASSPTETDARKAEAQRGLEALNLLEKQGRAEAGITKQLNERSVVLGELGNAQERLNTQVTSGQITELEGLQRLSEENAKRIPALTAIVEAYEKIAAQSKNPIDIVRADAARVELEKLAAQTDLVGDKFREIGKSATDNLLDNIKSGTMSGRQILKAFVSDIDKMFFDLGKKAISQYLFGKNGPLGGFDIGKITGDLQAGAKPTGTAAAATGSSGIMDTLSKFFGARKTGTAPDSLTSKSTEPGAFDQTGSVGTGLAANDEAFKSLTDTVATSQSAFESLNTKGLGGTIESFGAYLQNLVFGTAVEGTKNSTTASATASLGLLAAAADGARTALASIAAPQALSSVASVAAKAPTDALGGAASAVSGATGTAANETAFASLAGTVTAIEGSFAALAATLPAVDGGLAAIALTAPLVDTALTSLFGSATLAAGALDAAAAAASSSAIGSSASYAAKGFLASAKGNVFSGGNVIPFARGGVFDAPTVFPMPAGKIGLMAEAGPEAIMPLKRGPDGKLGVVSLAPPAPAVERVQSVLRNVFTKIAEITSINRSTDTTKHFEESTFSSDHKSSSVRSVIESLMTKRIDTAAIEGALRLVEDSAKSAAGALYRIVAPSGAADVAKVGELGAAPAVASARGNVFATGNVIPFAKGGIVDRPTVFPMKRGAGLMGEAGPEAVMPLKRTRDGALGVSMDGGGSTVNNYINVQAPQNRDLRTASQYGRAIGRQIR